MKTLILAVAAVFTMSANAFAQETNTQTTQQEHKRFDQTEMIQKQTDRMAKQLGLDDTQKAAVLKLNNEYAGKMHRGMGMEPRKRFERNDTAKMERPSEDQMKQMRAKMEEERKQMEESRTAYNAELKKILTDEQYTKYEEHEKLMMQRGGKRGGMRGPGPRMGDNNINSAESTEKTVE